MHATLCHMSKTMRNQEVMLVTNDLISCSSLMLLTIYGIYFSNWELKLNQAKLINHESGKEWINTPASSPFPASYASDSSSPASSPFPFHPRLRSSRLGPSGLCWISGWQLEPPWLEGSFSACSPSPRRRSHHPRRGKPGGVPCPPSTL